LDEQKFEELLKYSEDTWLDWKADFPPQLLQSAGSPAWDRGKGELLKDLVAIANGEGRDRGYLVYGVKDHRTHRELRKISKSWNDADFQTWASIAFQPPPRFLYSELMYEGHHIGVFEIDRIPAYPHVCVTTIDSVLYKGQTWFRNGSQNDFAKRDDLERMIRGEEPFLFERIDDPLLEDLLKALKQQNFNVAGPRYTQLDSLLASGWKVVHYPGTRRPVCAGGTKDKPDNIFMYKL